MKLTKNQLILLSSAGYGVLFSLAISGAARIIGGLAGSPLEPATANSIFGMSCLLLVPVTTYFRFAKIFFPETSSQS